MTVIMFAQLGTRAMRKRSLGLLIAVGFLVGSPVSAEEVSPPAGYKQLDSRKLAERLSALGMLELLEACAEQTDDRDASRFILARSKIAHVAARDLPLEDRTRLLDEAIDLLECLEAPPAESLSPSELLHHYRVALQLVEARGLLKPKPHALRLMYLQGGRADREVIAAMTEAPLARIEELQRKIADTLTEWRRDMKMLVTLAPELETLQADARYKAAWIRFYRALAVPDGDDRRLLLENAIGSAKRYADGDPSSGVKYWSQLLMGMCTRELQDRHALAHERLEKANVPEAAPAIRIQAMFEIVRNLVEWGRFAHAKANLEKFMEAGRTLLRSDGELEIDVKTTILKNYLYERWSLSETDPARARRYLLISQQAVLDFLSKYEDRPGVGAGLLDVFATRYRDRRDYQALNSVILLAVARFERSERGEGGLARPQKLLRMILDREDDISVSIRPDAMWELATLMNQRRLNLEAGRWFLRLASEFPDHRLGMRSAKNAIHSFDGIIRSRLREKVPIAPNLRREFINALEALLTRWGETDDLGKWYFDLGVQYQELAGPGDHEMMSKAIEAYERVPPTDSQWMQARHLALRLAVKLLAGDESLRPNPTELVRKLERYSRDAAATAAKTKDESRRRVLRQWGAVSGFQAASILYEHLGQEALGLEQIKLLPEQWADTEILPTVREFEIVKLVERRQTDEAIEKVEAFSEKYPDKSPALIRLVARQIRRSMEQIRRESATSERLTTYQEVFHRFAEKLFQDARSRGLPPDKTYPIMQMRAHALLGIGRYSEALEIFQQCAEYDQSLRQARANQIDREIDGRIEAVKAAATDAAEMRRFVDEYFGGMRGGDSEVSDPYGGMRIAEAVSFLNKAANPTEHAERMKLVVNAVIESLETLRKLRKRQIPTDPENIIGLARAHRAMGNYTDSLRCYNDLVKGIDRSAQSELYWSAQLERCECLLKAFRGDSEQMKRLAVLVRQLALADGRMGGYPERFNAIRSEALRFAR